MTYVDNYQTFIHKSRYARWNEDMQRRENWSETVQRYLDFFSDKLDNKTDRELYKAIFNLEVMPSMRTLATAGPALARDNIAGYNCAYTPIDHPRAFSEILHVLMNGTGVGYSVERKYIEQLPVVPEQLEDTDDVIVVADTKEGWSRACRKFISMLYYGEIPKWDLSRIRPAGTRLKTFGGRASGPEPLNGLFKVLIRIFKEAKGRRLTSLECHDIACHIASCVVVGGVRRSALISLSNLTDERMRTAKSGEWYKGEKQRSYANNSVAYTEKPDVGAWLKEWSSLYESKSGERGIFSRAAAKRTVAAIGRRDAEHDFGTNPCSEIILREKQFCNLSEVVVRDGDTIADLQRKVRLATILGTLQSTLTDFKFVGKKWKENCEEERLLGVSLTGIMDAKITSEPTALSLKELKQVAIETNKIWAGKLGIPPSTAITCVKPSGTVSQLVDAASGIHARHSEFYLRRARQDKKDPLSTFMIEQGVPYAEDPMNVGQWVFDFPVKSPKKSVMRNDRGAIEQLEMWSMYAEHWCEHKPSCTIYVKEDEWMEVGSWVYNHFDNMSGISFLPNTEHMYENEGLLPPYKDLTKQEYTEMVKGYPVVDWSKLEEYEKEDNTSASQEWACVGTSCEII